jgi:hypothetical protein
MDFISFESLSKHASFRMIAIIDDLLILAHNYHDLYDKIALVVRR